MRGVKTAQLFQDDATLLEGCGKGVLAVGAADRQWGAGEGGTSILGSTAL